MTATATKSPTRRPIQHASNDGPTDEALLVEYRETGREEAFAELVRRYEREIYGYLRYFLRDEALAEDVFQSTFLQLHLKCDQFRPDQKLRNWLTRIATNQAIDALRRNRRHKLASIDEKTSRTQGSEAAIRDILPARTPAPGERLEADDRKAWVHGAIRELPEPFRQVVSMVFLQGMKYREAAEALAIPLGTAKSRMNTALNMLRESCPSTFAPSA